MLLHVILTEWRLSATTENPRKFEPSGSNFRETLRHAQRDIKLDPRIRHFQANRHHFTR